MFDDENIIDSSLKNSVDSNYNQASNLKDAIQEQTVQDINDNQDIIVQYDETTINKDMNKENNLSKEDVYKMYREFEAEKKKAVKSDNFKNFYAGFFRRLFAGILDFIIVQALVNILDILNSAYELNYDFISSEIYFLLLFGIYNVIFTSAFGQSIGKIIFGIIVVSEKDEKLSFFTILVRELAGKIIMVKYIILYIFMPFSSKKHTFVDYLTDTGVIKEKSKEDFYNYKREQMMQK